MNIFKHLNSTWPIQTGIFRGQSQTYFWKPITETRKIRATTVPTLQFYFILFENNLNFKVLPSHPLFKNHYIDPQVQLDGILGGGAGSQGRKPVDAERGPGQGANLTKPHFGRKVFVQIFM
jgi:hypothetical protein